MFLFSEYITEQTDQPIPPEQQQVDPSQIQQDPSQMQQPQEGNPEESQPVDPSQMQQDQFQQEVPPDEGMEQVPPEQQNPEEPDISTDPQVIELKKLALMSKLERLQSNLWAKNIVIEELNTILEFASFFNYDLLLKLTDPILKIVKQNVKQNMLY